MQYSTFQNAALLFSRLVIAAVFAVAGYFKFPFWDKPMEGMTTTMLNITKLLSIVEPLGALALILGFLTRWAAAGLAIIMLGAIYIVQFKFNIGFTTPKGETGWNFDVTLLAGCIILMAFGAGRWSIDAARRRV
jgi:putative oxidoreductase